MTTPVGHSEAHPINRDGRIIYYYFLLPFIQRSQYIRPKVTLFKWTGIIRTHALFKGGSYTRKYNISNYVIFVKNLYSVGCDSLCSLSVVVLLQLYVIYVTATNSNQKS